ncbi:MAG: AsmA family protein [Desulfobacteraceae bacterium]|nr:AsmA family protein [Desulfobacteraceae bacterium]
MKKLLISVLCAALFVVIVLLVVIFNLGTIVKVAVNTYGPDIVKTELRLDKADVSVFKAQIRLENFVLGNPKGFSTKNAITVASILVDVDETTLMKDTIIIDRIEVIQPEITYEIKGTTDNFRAMIDNMKKPEKFDNTGNKEKPEKTSGEKDGKKFVIRDLLLKNIKVKTAAAFAGGDIISTTISEIHLKNVGEKQNGVDMAQAMLVVLNELYGQIVSPDILGRLENELKELEGGLDGIKDEMESIGGHLKSLF